MKGDLQMPIMRETRNHLLKCNGVHEAEKTKCEGTDFKNKNKD